MIDISNMGESALKSHMKSERHKNNSRIGGEQAVTLSSFGFVSIISFGSMTLFPLTKIAFSGITGTM